MGENISSLLEYFSKRTKVSYLKILTNERETSSLIKYFSHLVQEILDVYLKCTKKSNKIKEEIIIK